MALPALASLAGAGALTIHGPRWARDLYRDLDARVLPPGRIRGQDVAVLFAPSLRAAWEARSTPRRIGIAWDGRRPLLTDVVAPAQHTAATYGRLLAPLGLDPAAAPRWRRRSTDRGPDLPAGHIGLAPVTGLGAVKEWPGFRALADRLDAPVVFYGGPGEQARVRGIAGPHRTCVGLPLPAFADALSRCAAFVANDSGSAHFAAACGVPVVVVYGPTDAARTGPAGARAVSAAAAPQCRPCYARRCDRGDRACLRIDVDRVSAVLAEVLRG